MVVEIFIGCISKWLQKNGLTNQVRQDAILGGLFTGHLNLRNTLEMRYEHIETKRL